MARWLNDLFAQANVRRWWWRLALAPLALLVVLLAAASLSDLPDTEELENPRSDLATAVLFSDGSILGQYYRQNRMPVKHSDISPYVFQALIATEDVRFRQHSGIDLRGAVRAAVFMGRRGGASTISQQLAKMLFNDPSANLFKRIFQKLQEWIIAVKLERRYTKDEIMAMYLNRFDWINQAVGIRSAARVYFNTTPDSLNVQQAAMLVGMCKNPSLYNPLRREEATLARRMVVLDQMRKQKHFSQLAYDSLKALPLGLRFQRVDHTEGPAPYFREVLRGHLVDLLQEKDAKTGKLRIARPDGKPYDIYTDGLKVYTTLDRRMQAYGEFAVREHLGTELQPQFFKDLGRKKNRPFDSQVSTKEIEGIMSAARKRSDRWKVLSGKLCGNCKRPAAYIVKQPKDGNEHWHCDAAKGGCDTWWPVLDEKEMLASFDKPTAMRVFSWKGEVDTTLTPNDSIRWYKSFLQSGLLSLDPKTGFVKAWVGGIDFAHFQYDHVEQARRQVGSTFKPIVYATAMREGLDPCYRLPNQRVCFDMPSGQEDWCPENEGGYGGVVTLKYALAQSINTITAWLMKQYGPASVTVLARHMGIEHDLAPVPSLCLGVADLTLMEMTSAFSTFANKGVHIAPIYFTRIEDKDGNAIYDVTPRAEEAMDERTAYVMLDMMKGVVDNGTAARLRQTWGTRGKYGGIKHPIAGKTGTTQNNSDGWFIGITPDLVTGVWTGADDRSVRFGSTSLGQGANLALPIFGYYMNKVYADASIALSTADFERPEGIGPLCQGTEEEEVFPTLEEVEPDWEQ
jgi:penicillin-binding protein 1A